MSAQFGLTTRPAPPPTPADIGLVVALPIEIGPFLAKLESTRKYTGRQSSVIEGDLAGQVVAVGLVGVGRKAASRGAQLLIEGHRPRWVISVGFAGALDPTLSRNDVVMPFEVLDREGSRFTIDLKVAAGGSLRTGRLLTVDAVVRLASEKAALRQQLAADLVDMETSAVASLCSHRSQRFLSVRIISDSADVDLPLEITKVMGSSGSYQVGAALGAIWRRPSVLGELLSLRQQALESATKLATFLEAILPQLGS